MTTFDLNGYLASRRAAIDRALDRYLPDPRDRSHAIWRAVRYGLFPGFVQAKERLEELLHQSVKQLNSFGREAEPLRAIARFVEDRALHEEKYKKLQETQS